MQTPLKKCFSSNRTRPQTSPPLAINQQPITLAPAISAFAKKRKRPLALSALLLASLVFTGCAIGPDYKKPEIETPNKFHSAWSTALKTAVDAKDPKSDELLTNWWTSFNDPSLLSLVEAALEKNLDIRIALARIEEARARRGVSASEFYPSLAGDGSYQRRQNSLRTDGANFVTHTTQTHSLGLSSSWELDLWGRVRRSVEAADAEIDASVESARSILVAIAAETALAYVDLRLAEDRQRIAHTNIELQQKTVGLTTDQFNAKIVSELDVAQAQSQLASTEANLPQLRNAATQARNRLAVLTGVMPGTLQFQNGTITSIPSPPTDIAIGLPADLLRRRPDIRAAERRLAADTALIGVATADLYPRFSLAGTLGLEATDANHLFNSKAGLFGFGPTVQWNLFTAGRVRSTIEAQRTIVEASLFDYQQRVLLAVEETDNALSGFSTSQETEKALAQAVARAKRAADLSNDRYRRGLVGFQSVLDSQARQFALEDQLATTRAQTITNLITVYRSLGGGWQQASPKQEK